MFTRSFQAKAFLIGVLMLISGSLFAQAPTGTILGTVTDQKAGTLGGATVTVRNKETGLTRTVTTADDGAYRIPALPVGPYDVEVTHDGFKTATHTGLMLAVAQQAVIDMSMELGAVGQVVVVMGDAPIVNTTSGSLGGLVSQEKISDLPLNGRNYVDLSLMQLGVTQHKNVGTTAGMGGTWYSSNGAPLRSNSYLLDGANMVSLYGGTAGSIAGTSLGVEGIREYKVITNNFTAEYGMTMGSQMLIVSKGGTNQFHGSAFEYLRNSSLDARNFFDKTAFLPATAPGGGERLPPFRQNQFGGSFGGPIRKDKTFFFGTYETLHSNAGQTIVVPDIPLNCFGTNGKVLLTGNPCVPGGTVDARVQAISQLYPAPNLANPANPAGPFTNFTFPFDQLIREHHGQIRVDQNFSAADSFFARYTIDDTDQIKNGNFSNNTNIWVSRAQFATLAENHIFSADLLNTARFSFSRTHLRTDATIVGTGPGLSLVPGFDLGNISVSGVQTLGPDNFNPFSPTQNIFTWSDDLYYSKGSHSLKFGFLMNHYQQEVYEPNASMKGTVAFTSVATFLAAQYNTYNATVSTSQESVHTQNNTFGFYAQDDYRVGRNLTLNLGLRYEFSTVPREIYGVEGALRNLYADTSVTLGPYFKNPSYKSISPRVGFAWDIFGNGKTSLHGGFQEAYDIGAVGSVLVDQASRQQPFVRKITVAASTPCPGTNASLPLTIPLTLTGSCIGTANFSNTTGEIDYNVRQPHILQYNLAVERQLPLDFAITVAYAGSRGLNLWQGIEANPRNPTAVINGLPYWKGTEANLNPAFGSIFYQSASGDSFYNSLQFGLTKRLTKGLQLQSSLTYSKLLDDSQGQLTADGKSGYIANPFDERSAYGPAAFDTPLNWRFNFQYNLPSSKREGFVGKALSGWWTSGIVTMQTGYAFSPTLTTNVSKSGQNSSAGNIDLPDYVTTQNLAAAKALNPNAVVYNSGTVITGNVNQWFNPNMFTLPSVDLPASAPAGSSTIGTVSTNLLRMPGLATFDYSLVKDTRVGFLGEAGNLEFRAEFFNLFNSANFGKPSLGVLTGSGATGGVPISNAGQITATSTTARQIQFALKLVF